MKRRGKKNKKRCQQIHFRQRCNQRLGFVPSKQELEKLTKRIQAAESQFIEKQSNRVTVWRDCIEEIDVILIYDKMRKQIVTVVPFSWWIEQKGQKVG